MSEEKKTKEKEQPKATTTGQSKTPLFLLAGGIVAIIAVVVAIVLIAGRPGQAGEVGQSIPSDWNTYDAENYVIGYPSNWETSGSDTSLSISKVSENNESYGFDGATVSISVDSNDEQKAFIDAGNCQGLVDETIAQELAGGSEFGNISDSIKFNNVSTTSINGAKGCYFDVSVNFLFEISSKGYALVKGNDIYSVGVAVFGTGSADASTAEQIIQTFKFK